jgi:hypothetical protein
MSKNNQNDGFCEKKGIKKPSTTKGGHLMKKERFYLGIAFLAIVALLQKRHHIAGHCCPFVYRDIYAAEE